MRKLSNPVEGMGNAVKPDRYRPHGTRISSLLSQSSLDALKAIR